MSAITLLELGMGVPQLERRNAAQAKIIRTRLDAHVLPAFAKRVLSVDAAVALGVPAARPHGIVKKRRGVTADTEERLIRYFGCAPAQQEGLTPRGGAAAQPARVMGAPRGVCTAPDAALRQTCPTRAYLFY